MIQVELPLKPITVNSAFRAIPRGNYCTNIKSKKYRDFEKDCLSLLPKKEMIKGNVELTIEFYLKSRYKTTDTNNLIKPLIDILETARYFENDNKIIREHYYKYQAKDWKINIVINKA